MNMYIFLYILQILFDFILFFIQQNFFLQGNLHIPHCKHFFKSHFGQTAIINENDKPDVSNRDNLCF